ncbi:hypothetical protein B0H14DRAFT_3903754, partial [Mycena olivaceomarginata]
GCEGWRIWLRPARPRPRRPRHPPLLLHPPPAAARRLRPRPAGSGATSRRHSVSVVQPHRRLAGFHVPDPAGGGSPSPGPSAPGGYGGGGGGGASSNNNGRGFGGRGAAAERRRSGDRAGGPEPAFGDEPQQCLRRGVRAAEAGGLVVGAV